VGLDRTIPIWNLATYFGRVVLNENVKFPKAIGLVGNLSNSYRETNATAAMKPKEHLYHIGYIYLFDVLSHAII
jgi:hypothetical protein